MEDGTQRTQIAHEQAFFPHDVLLMPADQLACITPRKSSEEEEEEEEEGGGGGGGGEGSQAGALMLIDKPFIMTPRCCSNVPLQAQYSTLAGEQTLLHV